ncbi:MAG: FeoB-associated Cys-rich membrane protein [Lachnospiraceae bacterium]|nr:FeoB-associated Cys-rich membrane protein [Lachnospiraceae bacterium]
MTNLVVAGILLVIIGAAAAFLVKAKKSGARCIGCPDSGHCCGKGGADCGCHAGQR